MASLNDNKGTDDVDRRPLYAIVSFLPKKADGSYEIDLVPYSWLNLKDGKVWCAYPNTVKDLKKRETYLKNVSSPKTRWPQCEVEIISSTYTLEQGQRHLKRAETTRKVETDLTSDSNSPGRQDSNHSNVVVLPADGIINELNAVESMGSILSNTDQETGYHYDIQAVDENQEPITTHITYDDLLFDRLKNYIDEKFENMYERMEISKTSIEYVVKNEAHKIKTQIIMNSAENVPKMDKTTAMEPYKDMFPINCDAQFLNFDSTLNAIEKKNQLKNLFRVLMYGESDIKTVIRNTLSAVISPTVQLNYSSTGRKVNGVGKENFSSTATYICLKEVVEEKFGDSEQSKSLRAKVGSFLANAGDRDGGRRQRAINSIRNNQQQ